MRNSVLKYTLVNDKYPIMMIISDLKWRNTIEYCTFIKRTGVKLKLKSTQFDRVPFSTCPDNKNLRTFFIDHSNITQFYMFVLIIF